MTADLPNNPPDRQIRRRLKFMVDCMIRLTASLNEVGPRLPLLLLPEFDEEVDQDNFDVCVLPITPFRTENDANAVWEKASQALVDYNVGPSNVLNEIDGIFEELALNAAQHSRSPAGSRATLECYEFEEETVFLVGIADAGIGIPTSLRMNPEHRLIRDDQDAILRATELDVTGTLESRGVGLYHVTERIRAYRGELALISGSGFLMVKSGVPPALGNLADLNQPPYPGTIAVATIPIPSSR